MNSKLKDVLMVGCISFIVILPAILVFAAVWQQHLSLVHARDGVSVSPQNLPVPSRLTQSLLGAGLVGVPLGIWVVSVGQSLYYAYRRFAFKRQVARLERLWQHALYSENY